MPRYRVEGKSPLSDFEVVADKFEIKDGTVVFILRPFSEDVPVAAVPVVQLLSIQSREELGREDDDDQPPLTTTPFT